MSLSTFSNLGNSMTLPQTIVNGCIVGSGTSSARYLQSTGNLSALGTSYTIEFYMRNSTTGGTTENIIKIGPLECSFGVSTNALRYTSDAGTVTATTSFSLDTWRHIAFCKNESNLSIYSNGNQVASGSVFNYSLLSNAVTIFSGGTGFNPIAGTYVNNIRVTQGAIYTGNFTPPNQSDNLPLTQLAGTNISAIGAGQVKLLLTFQNINGNYFTDKSQNIRSWSLNNGGPAVSSVPTP